MNTNQNGFWNIVGIAFAVFLVGAVGWFVLNNTQSGPPSATTTQPTVNTSTSTAQTITQVVLYHYTGTSGAEYQSMIQTISPTPRVADAALKLLFQTYLPALESEYVNVTLEEGVATVYFKQGAHAYLDQAAPGISAEFVNSMRKTLQQFSTIYKVQFAIDGQVITAWDA